MPILTTPKLGLKNHLLASVASMAMTLTVSSRDQADRRLESPHTFVLARLSWANLGPRHGRPYIAPAWRDHYESESGLGTIPSSTWRWGPFATVSRPPMGLCEFMVVFFNSSAAGSDVIDADDNVAALQ